MQTALDDAKRKLTRAEELAAQELITQAELDEARITMQQATADVRAPAGRDPERPGRRETGSSRSRSDGHPIADRRNRGQPERRRRADRLPQRCSRRSSSRSLTCARCICSRKSTKEKSAGSAAARTVSFQVESLGPQTFHGTVADVRLQPYAEEAGAVATAGTAGASGLTAVSAKGSSGTPVPLGNTSTQTGSRPPAGLQDREAAGTTAPRAAIPPRRPTSSSASGSSSSAAAAPGAVTYTAVVDVPNADGLLAPGATAIVTLERRIQAGRRPLPNTALSFRPPPAMLERTGQADLTVHSEPAAADAARDRNTHVSQVWRFENNGSCRSTS